MRIHINHPSIARHSWPSPSLLLALDWIELETDPLTGEVVHVEFSAGAMADWNGPELRALMEIYAGSVSTPADTTPAETQDAMERGRAAHEAVERMIAPTLQEVA